jgi:hypothetical protein
LCGAVQELTAVSIHDREAQLEIAPDRVAVIDLEDLEARCIKEIAHLGLPSACEERQEVKGKLRIVVEAQARTVASECTAATMLTTSGVIQA